jgi:HPt (histidine-containing phosphotransfer) domain-containing protein
MLEFRIHLHENIITNVQVPFDLKYLNELFPDNPETIKDLLRMFTEHTSKDYQLFQKSIENKDIVAVKLMSHKLKSNVSIFGLLEIKELFARIEELANRQPELVFEEIAALYSVLDARMTEAFMAANLVVKS